jgi:hypothetical protein
VIAGIASMSPSYLLQWGTSTPFDFNNLVKQSSYHDNSEYFRLSMGIFPSLLS